MRLIPQLIAFPYPIGYDSITYYLPELVKININEVKESIEFPIYLYVVNLFSTIFSQNLYYSFLGSGIILYGIFSVTIFFICYRVIRQSLNKSLYISIFVIFQLPILRISWDLFRDLFSLIFLNVFLIIFSNLISRIKLASTLYVILNNFAAFLVTVLTIFSDRMIGMLLILISFAYSIFYKVKFIFFINLFLALIFLIYFYLYDKTTAISIRENFFVVLTSVSNHTNEYSPIDVMVLFLSLLGILIPIFIVGFKVSSIKNINLIKIPLIFSFLFSFSWIVVPNYSFLAPERWIIILSIFFSMVSVIGFLDISEKINKNSRKKLVQITFLTGFVVYGICYVVLPYEHPLSIPALFKNNTSFIFPSAMIFNSLNIKDNNDVVNIIDWINSHTPSDSVIIGSKHWRGWFNLLLNTNKNYFFIENILYDKNSNNLSIMKNMLLNSNFHELMQSKHFSTSIFKNNTSIYFLYYDTNSYQHSVTSYPFCKIAEFGYFKLYQLINLIPFNHHKC